MAGVPPASQAKGLTYLPTPTMIMILTTCTHTEQKNTNIS
jgi:hypothetical protein